MLKRVVIVDDQPFFCTHWKSFLEARFPEVVAVETYTDPYAVLGALTPDVHLLMLDLQMPGLDGKKVLEFAVARGVDRKRIVITSASRAEHLHTVFGPGECLAVINKEEPEQQKAFLMILDSVMRKP